MRFLHIYQRHCIVMAFKKICSINNLLIGLGKKKKVAAVALQLYKLIYLIQVVLQGPFKQRKNMCTLSQQKPSLFRIIFMCIFFVCVTLLYFFLYTSGVSHSSVLYTKMFYACDPTPKMQTIEA